MSYIESNGVARKERANMYIVAYKGANAKYLKN
jgi:hypothetical protein